jgi:hypothetical protein
METLVAACYANRCGVGGPDCANNSADDSTDLTRVTRGLRWSGTAWVSGGIDYRGLLSIAVDAQGPEMGGKDGSHSMATLSTIGVGTHGNTHFPVLRKTANWSETIAETFWRNSSWDGVGTTPTTPEIESWLTNNSAASPTVQTCPAHYGGACVS